MSLRQHGTHDTEAGEPLETKQSRSPLLIPPHVRFCPFLFFPLKKRYASLNRSTCTCSSASAGITLSHTWSRGSRVSRGRFVVQRGYFCRSVGSTTSKVVQYYAQNCQTRHWMGYDYETESERRPRRGSRSSRTFGLQVGVIQENTQRIWKPEAGSCVAATNLSDNIHFLVRRQDPN